MTGQPGAERRARLARAPAGRGAAQALATSPGTATVISPS
jgi:hypothetical protein